MYTSSSESKTLTWAFFLPSRLCTLGKEGSLLIRRSSVGLEMSSLNCMTFLPTYLSPSSIANTPSKSREHPDATTDSTVPPTVGRLPLLVSCRQGGGATQN